MVQKDLTICGHIQSSRVACSCFFKKAHQKVPSLA
ncbi:hypothetical protein NC653_010474 [Populus alba x Populus x berolinensis]|uniref:Uncharacterized protein n=1 Tax=Populus alba x Populus x berolinensis TaxID=444605 RepID=A0AAD6W5A4_9ROSI|nr:hypothetical protein NC653_010474 [Populus alba x Populus x berolinensis]